MYYRTGYAHRCRSWPRRSVGEAQGRPRAAAPATRATAYSRVSARGDTMKSQSVMHRLSGMEIAVIGMAGRFPGANNLEVFWRNIRDGIESVSVLSEPEL